MGEAAAIPIIKLYHNLIVSIQIELSDAVMKRLMDDLAREIERTSPRGLIVDVSGVELMDSYISRAIRDMGQMARLMGVATVICGLKPMVAMTLVDMEMDFQGVMSALNLETALDMMQMRHAQDQLEDG